MVAQMTMSTVSKMGLVFDSLMPYTITITKFVGNEVIAMGVTTLPSTLGTWTKAVTKIICFSVIDLLTA